MAAAEAATMDIALEPTGARPLSLVAAVKYVYHDLWEEVGDPRANHYPMMTGGPWPTIALVLTYVYLVKVAGPRYMKDRPAYDLRALIRLYNVSLVLWNAYFFYYFTWFTGFGVKTLVCTPPDPTAFDEEWRFKLRLGWLFYMSKFVDFVDTFFFVLRKKQGHVSTLHVCHHGLMPINVWLGLKLIPTPSAAFVPFINSLVHAIMYSYYALSTWPSLRPYLWWKRYLTQLQIVQIFFAVLHLFYIGLVPACRVPRLLFVFAAIQGVFILTLFCLFYINSYVNTQRQHTKDKLSKAN
ncbi:Elongation of very long chain fatty acids protein 1 [Halotydeus destructor]|nr:Elongation of very long chain fatty acids protein 1 [Halotydeus destructor]